MRANWFCSRFAQSLFTACLFLVSSFVFAETNAVLTTATPGEKFSTANVDVPAQHTVQQPTPNKNIGINERLMINPIGKVESSLDVKGEKLPLATKLSGNLPGIPSELRTKPIYIELKDSPMLTVYFKNELGRKGYQFVDDKTQAVYVIMGRGVYFSKSRRGQTRFGGPIGPLVEKSGGIDKIEVDNFPDYVGGGGFRATTRNVDIGIVESVANHSNASTAGGIAGGVAVAVAVDYIGEKTGLKSAVNNGFTYLVGGGNLGLDDPMCFLGGCEKTQTIITDFVVRENGEILGLFKIETILDGTKKHMPNEILAENLKNCLPLF